MFGSRPPFLCSRFRFPSYSSVFLLYLVKVWNAGGDAVVALRTCVPKIMALSGRALVRYGDYPLRRGFLSVAAGLREKDVGLT